MYTTMNPLQQADIAHHREQVRQGLALRRARARLRKELREESRRRKAMELAS